MTGRAADGVVVAAILAATVLAAGCDRTALLEAVPRGSRVDVVTHDSVVVTGRLVEVGPELIRIAGECDRPILVARTEVARVTVTAPPGPAPPCAGHLTSR